MRHADTLQPANWRNNEPDIGTEFWKTTTFESKTETV